VSGRSEHAEILDTARLAARAGRAVVASYFRQASLEVRAKGRNDFVSRADRESEEAIVAAIRGRHPDHDILAEEGGAVVSADSDFTWMIDPLDGTTNFLHGLPIFAVSVACWRRGRPVACVVLDPGQGDEYEAVAGGGAFRNGERLSVSGRAGLDGAFLATGYPFKAHRAIDIYLALFRSIFLRAKAIRRPGAAALDLANTAAGVYDGFFEFRLGPWDMAAGILLIEEAGGVVSDLDGGDRYLDTGNLVAGTPGVHRELLALVAEHTSESHLDETSPRG
jgi:myo-inositol-1(or 4)-monophosphatase